MKGGRNQRSWKNIVLDGPYQVVFTMVLVLSVALVIGILSYKLWNQVTVASEVARVRIDVEGCERVIAPPKAPSTDTKVKVVIDEPELTMVGDGPSIKERVTACKRERQAKLDELESDQQLILYCLIGIVLVLVSWLTFYGLKLTHRVAGPVFKIIGYMRGWPDGEFKQIYKLRKKDELDELYAHFEAAHQTLGGMDRSRVEMAREFVDSLSDAQREALGEPLEAFETLFETNSAEEPANAES